MARPQPQGLHGHILMGRHQRRGRHAADCQRVHVRPLENGEIDEQLKSLRNRLSVLESQALEITEGDVVDFMMHGFDRTDEDMIFGAVVRQAYLFADCVLLGVQLPRRGRRSRRNKVRAPGTKKCEPKKGSHLIALVSEAGFEPAHPLSGH